MDQSLDQRPKLMNKYVFGCSKVTNS